MAQEYTNQEALSAIWKMYRAHTTSIGDGYRCGNNMMPNALGSVSGVRTGNLVTNPYFGNNNRIGVANFAGLPVGGQFLDLSLLVASGWWEMGQNPKTKF